MKKRIISMLMLSSIVLGAVAPSAALADELDSQIKESNNKIKELSSKEAQANTQLASVRTNIDNIKAEAAELQAKQDKIAEKISKLASEIKELDSRIDKRDATIKEQARSVQVDGKSSNFLDAVLNSDSISLAVTRLAATTKLVNASNDLMKQQEEDKKAVEAKQAETKEKSEELNENAVALEVKKGELLDQELQQESLVNEISAEKSTEENKKSGFLQAKAEAEAERARQVALREAAEAKAKEIAQAEAIAQAQKEQIAKAQTEKALKEISGVENLTTDSGAFVSTTNPVQASSEATENATTEGNTEVAEQAVFADTESQTESQTQTQQEVQTEGNVETETTVTEETIPSETTEVPELQPQPAPMPEPTPEPTPAPMPEPTPEPTPAPMPEPTPEPAPAPKPEPTPEPAPAPKPEPTPEPEEKPAPPAPPVANPSGSAIVAEAMKHLGKPYVWGAKGPEAFDCSGFTAYVYRQVTGREIGGYTVPQESAGTQIAVSQAQPGDLLFWGAHGGTYHVAISTGGGNYVHAATPSEGVITGSVQWYAPDFAVRVL